MQRQKIRVNRRALRMAPLLLCAITAGHGQAADTPDTATASLPDVTVIAPKPPTEEQLAGEAVPHFVESHATPSTVIHQLTRWRTGICPRTRGLSEATDQFITARMRAIATAVGAPWDESPKCKPNVDILFTGEPQQVLDVILKQNSERLGFHYKQQEKQLATFTLPIQGWYVTSTRNWTGHEVIDDAAPLGVVEGKIRHQGGSKVPPGEPGSRLTNLRSSQVVLALIVVDGNKAMEMNLKSLTDYLAMLTLSQATPSDTCSQLPSIMDLLSTHCAGGDKPVEITSGDLAFLRALYRANLETPIELEQSNIENAMMLDFHKKP
jgi:hypothetical protein